MNSLDPLMLQAFEKLSEGVYIVDAQRKIVFWNEAAEKITGFSRDDVVGSFCMHNILNHIDEDGTPLCLGACPLATVLEDGEEHEDSLFLHHYDGFRIPIHVKVIPIKDDSGNILGAIEIFMETAAEAYVTFEDQMLHAFAGNLPDADNRLSSPQPLERFLKERLNKVRNISRMPMAVLVMEVDEYDELCKDLSPEEKHQVERTVAMSLRTTLQPIEDIGRWKASGFVAVSVNASPAGLKRMAEKAVFMVGHSTPLRATNKPLKVTLSVGAAIVESEDTVSSALERAQTRLERCRKAGGNQVCVDESAPISMKQ